MLGSNRCERTEKWHLVNWERLEVLSSNIDSLPSDSKSNQTWHRDTRAPFPYSLHTANRILGALQVTEHIVRVKKCAGHTAQQCFWNRSSTKAKLSPSWAKWRLLKNVQMWSDTAIPTFQTSRHLPSQDFSRSSVETSLITGGSQSLQKWLVLNHVVQS